MECWTNGVRRFPAAAPPPPPPRCRDYPSFSSTLLDAIYRSIDETDAAPDPISAKTKIAAAGISLPPTNFSKEKTISGRRRRCTSSSSDGSSYGGFSSSDPESIPAVHPIALRPIRTPARFRPIDGHNPPIAVHTDQNRSKNKNRLRDLTNGRTATPSSPGARLANFLNSIFAAKSKIAAVSSPAAKSSPCLKRSPARVGKRTVRFSPASLVAGGEEEDDGSDSSSDLFELKNLAAVGRMRDELPVYGTTGFGNYGGDSRGRSKIVGKGLGKEKYKERC